jgi:mRNA interferase MazF
MRRGEIWTVAGGPDYTGKPRPAVILQDDAFDATRSVTVCPLTSIDGDYRLARPAIEPSEENGLRIPSRLMVDKTTTVARGKVSRPIGRLSSADIARLNRAVFVFLGLGSSLSPGR